MADRLSPVVSSTPTAGQEHQLTASSRTRDGRLRGQSLSAESVQAHPGMVMPRHGGRQADRQAVSLACRWCQDGDRLGHDLSVTDRSVIDACSWRLASELLRRHPALTLNREHPGGGLYDCLVLRDLTNTGASVQLNRAGRIHVHGRFNGASGEWEPASWETYIRADPRDFLLGLEAAAGLEPPRQVPPSTPAVLAARAIASLVSLTVKTIRPISVEQGFIDSSGYGAGPNPNLDHFPQIPAAILRPRSGNSSTSRVIASDPRTERRTDPDHRAGRGVRMAAKIRPTHETCRDLQTCRSGYRPTRLEPSSDRATSLRLAAPRQARSRHSTINWRLVQKRRREGQFRSVPSVWAAGHQLGYCSR